MDNCITKERPDYSYFVDKLKTLKQHFSFNKTKVKIMDNLAILAGKVNKQDRLLHKMVGDMQGRISKFREDMLAVEP